MPLDYFALGASEAAGLREDLLGDSDLADVVEERAEFEPFQRARVETDLLADLEREVRDPARMRRRVLVVRLECVRQRLDRGEERVLEAREVARVRDRELRLVRETGEKPQLALAECLLGGARNARDDAAATVAVERERRHGERCRLEDRRHR